MRRIAPLLAALLLALPAQAEENKEIVFEPFEDDEQDEAPPAAAAEPADEELQWIVIELRDGSTLSGTLIRYVDQGLEIRSGTEVVVVPMERILRVVAGGFEDESPAEPAVESTPATARPAQRPPPAHRGSSAPYLELSGSPAFLEYRDSRLQLTDGRGRWIGPKSSGYHPDDLGRLDRKRFHVIRPSDPRGRLSIPEFARLADLPVLTEELRLLEARNRSRLTGGLVLLAIGQGLLTAAIIAGTAYQQTQDINHMAGMPFFASGAGTTLAIGSIVTISGLKHQKRLSDIRLDRVWERSEAWRGVEAYNSRLRQDLGLPDDDRLDGPED